jgi:hypothetical protein
MTLNGSKHMKHDIREFGFRVLDKVPDTIKDYSPSEKDTIIETGGMVSIYNFMQKTREVVTPMKSSQGYDDVSWSGCKT